MSAFLQLLKKQRMRCGEAKRLQWINIDFAKNVITLNEPEKRQQPARMWKASQNLIACLTCYLRKAKKYSETAQ